MQILMRAHYRPLDQFYSQSLRKSIEAITYLTLSIMYLSYFDIKNIPVCASKFGNKTMWLFSFKYILFSILIFFNRQ